VTSVVLDGEGVICGPDGKSDFDRMRSCFSRQDAPEALLYAFDVLELDGRDLRNEPWARRRTLLAQLLADTESGIRLCEHIGRGRRCGVSASLCGGVGGHRRQASRQSLPFWTYPRMD
jgi:ATP-dependent DNA ligase